MKGGSGMFGSVHMEDEKLLLRTIIDAVTHKIRDHPPTFIELGVHSGRTSIGISKLLSGIGADARVIGIDKYNEGRRKVEEAARTFERVLLEYEHSISWEAARFHNGEPIVWVFVDACHCLECVRNDIQAWAPLVVPGGFIVFHDADILHQDRNVHARYHGDGRDRPYGVVDAIVSEEILWTHFKTIGRTWAVPQPKPQAPYFGGTWAFRRRGTL